VPLGVIYKADAPVYEREVMAQVEMAQSKRDADLRALYFSDDTWTVEGNTSYTDKEMRDIAFGQTLDVASEFDEAYVENMKDEVPISGIARSDIHDGLAHDPLSNLVNMEREVITVKAADTLADAVEIMQSKNIGALVVTDEQKRPIGIFTEFDVLKKVATQIDDLGSVKIAEVMTKDPDTLPAHAPIAQALHLMNVHNYRHVPITGDGNIVKGIVSFRDVVRYIEQYFDTDKA
ncbi:MAG: CBS domain-containing protein, partial [Chloroflexota bacterium]